jgi:hypothetical protein
MTLEEIGVNLELICDKMSLPVSIDNPEGILTKLNDLSNLLGLNSQCLTSAEMLYNKKIGELIQSSSVSASLGAAEKKQLYAYLAATEVRVLRGAENISRDLHYQLDSLRTMISYLKAELNNIPK